MRITSLAIAALSFAVPVAAQDPAPVPAPALVQAPEPVPVPSPLIELPQPLVTPPKLELELLTKPLPGLKAKDWLDLEQHAFELKEHSFELEQHFFELEKHPFDLDIELDMKFDKLPDLKFEKLTELHIKAEKLAEFARQVPVPPVPPVPPRDATRQREAERREAARQREQRRKIPEGWVETTEPFSRSFPVGKASVLLLVNISGNIQVTAGSGQIEVEAMKRVWAPNAEDGKRRLADVSVEVYATGNRVELRVEHNPGKNTGNVDVEFNIKVPSDGSVDLRSVSGDIKVTNVRGEVRTQTVNGNLSLDGTPRLTSTKTVGGDIQITNGGADTLLSLSTVNGDVLVQTLTARTVELNTINGDVRIAGWTGDRANLRTLSGDLDLSASFTKAGRYDIESHSGDIRLALPDQPGFEIEANTYSGRIRVDFSIKSEGPVRDSDRGPRSVRGTYGDGASSLRVQTFSGDVVVTRR